jgi:hypothetical protein
MVDGSEDSQSCRFEWGWRSQKTLFEGSLSESCGRIARVENPAVSRIGMEEEINMAVCRRVFNPDTGQRLWRPRSEAGGRCDEVSKLADLLLDFRS